MKKGMIYLVGAGPGDPGLITVRGAELLRLAEVVVYDHLVSPGLLKACPPTARLLYVGKQAKRHTKTQEVINRLLIREAKRGRMVVRLKGGDPFVFGRGAEEALALGRAKIPYEVVPGVTSAIAVPAYAGIPVTHRAIASSFAVITGHEDPTKAGTSIQWDSLARGCDTLVCLMGVSELPQIVTRLAAHGRTLRTPCALIEWGTLPRQRVVAGTLGTIVSLARRAKIHPPAVLVVGHVVALRRSLNWFEAKPLFGKRILVTRAADNAASLTRQVAALGAEVEELPAIELAPVKQNGFLRDILSGESKPDWVFFTSPEGIGWFARALKPYRRDVRWLSGCHIGAIGQKTAAAIEGLGVHVDFVPRRFSQEGLLKELPARLLRGRRALIFSAEESRDVLRQGLRQRGMNVAQVAIYRTVMPASMHQGIAAMLAEPFDAVTVTSASCADHVYEALRAIGKPSAFKKLSFVSIGPVTSRAVRSHGGKVLVEARASTIEGLVDALVKHLGSHHR